MGAGIAGLSCAYELVRRGHQVTAVSNGRAALEALRAESFDVALLDIVMPEMDGLEVLRQVREEPDSPEIIIITGNGTIETAITAMKLGSPIASVASGTSTDAAAPLWLPGGPG